ncbi:MAG: DUF499 domain-containing protein [Sphaerochaetaceae bacterium]|jgi:predicted AAA+ superfamily ATPase
MKNHEMVNTGFRHALKALAPYVARELRSAYGDHWWQDGVLNRLTPEQQRGLPVSGSEEELTNSLDILRCLQLIDWQWNEVFRKKLANDHRSWVKELIGVRHEWAHAGQEDFEETYTWRALDTMSRLIDQIDEIETESIRELIRTVRYGSVEGSLNVKNVPNTEKPAIPQNAGIIKTAPIKGLRPWRDVITPHPDVATGQYKNAEFAADLAQVARGEGSIEYRDPVEFFARTYITVGMKGLLVEAIKRVIGKDGEPVIQLKTAFGGGKTHSMLALYHLLRGRTPLEKIPSATPVLKEAGVTSIPRVHVAVIVGTALDPSRSRRPVNMPGITINTLWGEIAAQLAESSGNRELYDYVKKADGKGVSPGSNSLRAMFDKCGPCMILIDELVAYAKKLYGVSGLPAGSYDNLITFIQELTEAASTSKNSLVVASLPESELEVGGEAGQKVLETLEHTFGRKEAIWKPVAANEGFEVVRRRLFLNCTSPADRDEVCNAFSNMYTQNASDFPIETKELDYRDRLVSCYPIHPEVFDRLYEDWATLERFQRTRGVLRLMAAVVYDLWMKHDASLMIMPASFSLDNPIIRDELSRHLSESWNAVIERDVDGPKSVPYQKDKEHMRFGNCIAARRVARTIMLGSAPSVKQMNVRGIEQSRIRLGVIQPGEQISVFNDALSILRTALTYLYSNNEQSRYWYDTRPTLRKTMDDRASRLADEEVLQELERRLRSIRRTDPFSGIHCCPSSSLDVPDEQTIRLVILPPSVAHSPKDSISPALKMAMQILDTRGSSPRMYKNMLAFVAADSSINEMLFTEIKRYLAWLSIKADSDELNLDASQVKETEQNINRHNSTIDIRVNESFSWLFVPYVDVEKDLRTIQWHSQRITGSKENCAVRAGKKMLQEEAVITKWAPALLTMELQRWFWKDKPFVKVKDLWDFLCTYCYLPRLSNYQVLENAIQSGIESDEYFGVAEGIKEEGSYLGLKFKTANHFIDRSNYLLTVDEAKRVIQEKIKKDEETSYPDQADQPGGVSEDHTPGDLFNPPSIKDLQSLKGPTHFYLSTKLDTTRYIRDIGKLNEEVLNHLLSFNGNKVDIRLDVQIDFKEEVPSDIIRTVTENCRTLKVEDSGFE